MHDYMLVHIDEHDAGHPILAAVHVRRHIRREVNGQSVRSNEVRHSLLEASQRTIVRQIWSAIVALDLVQFGGGGNGFNFDVAPF